VTPRRTAINAGWVVAFDGRGHRLLRDGVVVVEGDRIVHVGPGFDGAADETIDARDRVLTPGLITTHAHMAGSPLDRSCIEDRGSSGTPASSRCCRCAAGRKTRPRAARAWTSRWSSCCAAA
jgi:imidazolonepropionase-like amidohydrolase